MFEFPGRLGQGTWRMGEVPARRREEIASLREGVERGLSLIDTAEMYGDGETEKLVGEAISGLRDRVFLVSKVYPHNASRRALPLACEASLRRLGVEALDLYLLHWRGSVPLDDTVEAMERMRAAGKIRAWGVSNLDVADLEELGPALGDCATDQVLLSLEHRGTEFDLLPFCRQRGMPVMAYSPVGQGGRLLRHPALAAVGKAHGATPAQVAVGKAHGATPAQVALAWVLSREGVMAIPKAGTRAHLLENIAALELTLTAEDHVTLDVAFHPPTRKRPLAML